MEEDAMAPTPITTAAGDTVVLWAVHFTGYNWSVAYCPTWDSAFYCEYATHCGTNIISRPEGMGYNISFGGPTQYWYVNDDELLELGKDADVWIFPSNRWDDVYAAHNKTMDQIKAVKNKQVYDNQGSGTNAWFEQRLAEYDVVGLDLCDIVGSANPNGPPHKRRWFRNIFYEEIGTLPVCNVPDDLIEGDDVIEPYKPIGAECELLTEEDFMTEEETMMGDAVAPPQELSLDWTIMAYPQGAAQVGDTLTFNWQGEHNVYVHPSGDCTMDGAILIGEESGASHTFTADQVGEVTFACDIYNGAHCGAGQIITYVVTDASSTVDDAANMVDDAANMVDELITDVEAMEEDGEGEGDGNAGDGDDDEDTDGEDDEAEMEEEDPADQVSKQGDEESSKEPVSSAAATTLMGAVATFVAMFAL